MVIRDGRCCCRAKATAAVAHAAAAAQRQRHGPYIRAPPCPALHCTKCKLVCSKIEKRREISPFLSRGRMLYCSCVSFMRPSLASSCCLEQWLAQISELLWYSSIMSHVHAGSYSFFCCCTRCAAASGCTLRLHLAITPPLRRDHALLLASRHILQLQLVPPTGVRLSPSCWHVRLSASYRTTGCAGAARQTKTKTMHVVHTQS